MRANKLDYYNILQWTLPKKPEEISSTTPKRPSTKPKRRLTSEATRLNKLPRMPRNKLRSRLRRHLRMPTRWASRLVTLSTVLWRPPKVSIVFMLEAASNAAQYVKETYDVAVEKGKEMLGMDNENKTAEKSS